MRLNRRRELEVLSISALDIFASALGVFILVAIILFPYYLKQPSIEIAEAGARAELAAAERARVQLDDEAQKAEARVQAASQKLAALQAEIEAGGTESSTVAPEPKPGEQPAPLTIGDLDLVFVMDTTGSMRPELQDVQANLVGIIRVLNRLSPSLRVGFVAYRDRGEAYVTRSFPLQTITTPSLARMVAFVDTLSAEGGGDNPEAVAEALRVALAMPWRDGAEGRIILIGDAPAHPHEFSTTMQMARTFESSSDARPRTVAAITTGQNPAARIFFERLAAAGGGGVLEHQNFMIESVLLSILPDAVETARRR